MKLSVLVNFQKNYQKPQQGPQGKEDISDMIDDFVKRDKFDKTIRELKDWIKKVEDKIENLVCINPFVPNAPFLYPLKISENQRNETKHEKSQQ